MNVLTVMISIMGVIVDQDQLGTVRILEIGTRSRFASTFFTVEQSTMHVIPYALA
jgi:hypothetical protein